MESVAALFNNGITVGAYATQPTSLPEEFGEGSFGQGYLLHLPAFDAFLARSASPRARWAGNPLTRDGGAKAKPRF